MSCCSGPDYETMLDRWREYLSQRSEAEMAIVRVAFESIRGGNPFPVSRLADSVDVQGQSLVDLVGRMAALGLITLSPVEDTITGANGLSVVPSRHQLLLNGVELYAWCALDAVGIPAALDADARVESRCGSSGDPLSFEFQSGRLARASHPDAMVWVLPPEAGRSVCGDT